MEGVPFGLLTDLTIYNDGKESSVNTVKTLHSVSLALTPRMTSLPGASLAHV